MWFYRLPSGRLSDLINGMISIGDEVKDFNWSCNLSPKASQPVALPSFTKESPFCCTAKLNYFCYNWHITKHNTAK